MLEKKLSAETCEREVSWREFLEREFRNTLFAAFSVWGFTLLENNGHWCSLADEQGDVRNILFHHGNSLTRTICIAGVHCLLVVIGRDSNFGSARLSLFPDPIKHIASVLEIDSRRGFFLHSMICLQRFAVLPKGFRRYFRLNL